MLAFAFPYFLQGLLHPGGGGAQQGAEPEGEGPDGTWVTQTWIHFLANVTLGNLPEPGIE